MQRRARIERFLYSVDSVLINTHCSGCSDLENAC